MKPWRRLPYARWAGVRVLWSLAAMCAMVVLAGVGGCGPGRTDLAAVEQVMQRAVPLEANCAFAAAPNGRDDVVALVTSRRAKDKLVTALREADLDARVLVGEDRAGRDAIEQGIRDVAPRATGSLGWSMRRTAPSTVAGRNELPTCGRTVVTLLGYTEPTAEYVEFEKMLRRDYGETVTVENRIIVLE